MYEIEVVDVINFSNRFAIIEHFYKSTQCKYKKHHIVNLLCFLKNNFKSKDNDKHDIEFMRLILNLYEWITNIKNWKKVDKISLRMPDSIMHQKWSNIELDMFSTYLNDSIISKPSIMCFQSKKVLDNPLGIVDWLVNVLLQKYNNNTNLKQILNTFIETQIV